MLGSLKEIRIVELWSYREPWEVIQFAALPPGRIQQSCHEHICVCVYRSTLLEPTIIPITK